MIFMASAVAPAEKKAGAINVRDEQATTVSVVAELTEGQRKELVDMKDDPNIYDKLARCVEMRCCVGQLSSVSRATPCCVRAH
jgi:hypothetical protein